MVEPAASWAARERFSRPRRHADGLGHWTWNPPRPQRRSSAPRVCRATHRLAIVRRSHSGSDDSQSNKQSHNFDAWHRTGSGFIPWDWRIRSIVLVLERVTIGRCHVRIWRHERPEAARFASRLKVRLKGKAEIRPSAASPRSRSPHPAPPDHALRPARSAGTHRKGSLEGERCRLQAWTNMASPASGLRNLRPGLYWQERLREHRLEIRGCQ